MMKNGLPAGKAGFTLIETVIYIVLLGVLIGGGVVAAFYILDSAEKNKADINVQAEGNFIVRKIEWALTGATTINVVSPTQLNVTKPGLPTMIFYLSGTDLKLGPDTSSGVNLNSSLVTLATISGIIFTDIPAAGGKPEAVSASFNVNGKNFNLIKYLRK